MKLRSIYNKWSLLYSGYNYSVLGSIHAVGSPPQGNGSCRKLLKFLPYVTKWEGQGQNGQRLAEVSRERGILTVINCLCLALGHNSKTARIQNRTTMILKRRYTSYTQVDRPMKTTNGGTMSQRATSVSVMAFLSLPLRNQDATALS